MARQNIFDLIAQKTDITTEANRLVKLFAYDKTIIYKLRIPIEYTLEKYLSEYAFVTWRGRGHVTNLAEFLNMSGYSSLSTKSRYTLDDFISLSEILLNLWKAADATRKKNTSFSFGYNYNLLLRIIEDNLAACNYKAMYDKVHDYYLIVEAKPEVTAVAEIVEEGLAFEVLRYNHRTLKGNLQEKKKILFSLGQSLEINRKQLQGINNQLADAIFTILNNMGIRHNNPHNEEVLANLTQGELEEWYDELYQMMLLAKLELDNIERMNKYKTDLKPKLI